jgi:hypothetical protein
MRKISWAIAVIGPLLASPMVRAQGAPQTQVQAVGITQLPPAVQDTFLAEIGNGRVEGLRKQTTASGDRYVGEVINLGQVTDIEVNARGVVVARGQPRNETPAQRVLDR